MRREGTLEEISDGHLYTAGDLVRVGCRDCEGCSACCHGMEALILDPLDIYRLTTGLGRPFEDFLEKELELVIADGMILPKMKMQDGQQACAFLNAGGRCSIHTIRPGICRLFPLGRYYHDGDFSYILQVNECVRKNRYKMKVSQWIDENEPEKNRRFINTWHDLCKSVEALVSKSTDEERRRLLPGILRLFYQQPYRPEDFYGQFEERIAIARKEFLLPEERCRRTNAEETMTKKQ